MTMTMSDDVANIALMISESLLDFPIVPGVDVVIDEGSRVTCVVHVHGAFEGAVVIECAEDLATRLTATMLQSAGEPSPAEVVDAIGELGNMFAGNLKAILAKPSVITLPTVVFGSRDGAGIGDAAVVARVPFAYDGAPLVVSLVQR